MSTDGDARHGVVSVGVAGALGPEAIARIAAAVEQAGFHALWVNDTPHGDSIAALTAAAAATERLTLATGVIPLDRRPPGEVAEAIRAAGLPESRVSIGIGSGGTSRGALALVREGIELLHGITRARVLIGALGPKMRELAAREADGVLLNWVSPAVAAEQAGQHRDSAGARPGRVVVYARTVVDDAARGRLRSEVAGYASAPKYAANFARLGLDPFETVLPQPGDDDIRPGIVAYTSGVDELVLRAITPDDDVQGYLDFVRRAADALGRPTPLERPAPFERPAPRDPPEQR
ncbi:LLM class flavin-dependent oxidoreductase [Micromonospora sp. DT81.3]|uniref:LLM class flavin-dependent oxidoreductase n=1 Tax=Micromonospora sp. DT81.3 TaxID=3416523 RepID=UPI003CF0047C